MRPLLLFDAATHQMVVVLFPLLSPQSGSAVCAQPRPRRYIHRIGVRPVSPVHCSGYRHCRRHWTLYTVINLVWFVRQIVSQNTNENRCFSKIRDFHHSFTVSQNREQSWFFGICETENLTKPRFLPIKVSQITHNYS